MSYDICLLNLEYSWHSDNAAEAQTSGQHCTFWDIKKYPHWIKYWNMHSSEVTVADSTYLKFK